MLVLNLKTENSTEKPSSNEISKYHKVTSMGYTLSSDLIHNCSKLYPNIEIDKNGDNNFGKYNKICFGGTFDHVHYGHYLLFTQAAILFSGNGDIVIGVSDGKLLEDKVAKEAMESFEFRKANVEHCLMQIHPQILLPSEENKTFHFDVWLVDLLIV